MPPRGIGIGLPPQVPSQIPHSYTNRKQHEAEGGSGENEQGNSLDFIQGMMKRDILSSPKTSANHERSSQQALVENRKAGTNVGRKSPLRMSQDMVHLHNRNRILKPVTDQSQSAYGQIEVINYSKNGTTKHGSSVAISGLQINGDAQNQHTSRPKLLKSTERLEKYSAKKQSEGKSTQRPSGSRGNPQNSYEGQEKQVRRGFHLSPDLSQSDSKKKQIYQSSVEIKGNSGAHGVKEKLSDLTNPNSMSTQGSSGTGGSPLLKSVQLPNTSKEQLMKAMGRQGQNGESQDLQTTSGTGIPNSSNPIIGSQVKQSLLPPMPGRPKIEQGVLRPPPQQIIVPQIRRPIIEKAKVSQRPLIPNMIAYGANTHNGLVRNYNEDRISIVLDLKKPGIQPNSNKQPKFQIQFFAIFDGHGG